MASKPKNTAVATAPKSTGALPAHLQTKSREQIGNVDITDRILPRVKLIQKTSEEPDTYDAAKPGEFWHTLGEASLGESVRIVPIIIRKSYVLWAPRGDDRGILARSNDAKHWDLPNTEFEVTIKGAGKVKYNTGDDVQSSGLTEFGSSIPGESNSRPAASLTYNALFFMPDFPELSPAVIINTRSSVKPMKALLSKIDARPVNHYYQVYNMVKTDEEGEEGPYYGYNYTADGYLEDEQVAAVTKGMFELYSQQSWRASDEDDNDQSEGNSGGKPRGRTDRSDF